MRAEYCLVESDLCTARIKPPENQCCKTLARLLEFYSQRASRVRRDIYRLAAQAAEFRFAVLGLEPAAERKIIGTPEAISGSLPGSKANPLLGDRLFIQMPYDSDDFFKEFSPALRHAGYYEGLQAILRRIEFNTGLAYGDLSDPATVEKTATEVMSAKIRKFNTVKALEDRFKAALENAVYGVDVYATLYGLAPRGEYALYIDFDDSILTDKDALRERDRQDVRDGLMQKWEYRVKWYNETEEVAKSMCPVESTADPFNLG